jgi:uncharacterized protein (TIGR03067 family)
MRTLLGLALMFCLTALTSQAADEKKADKDAPEKKASLEGTWDLVSIEFQGQKLELPKEMALSLTFKDGKVTKKETGKKDEEGTFKVDDAKEKKEIDLTTPKKDKPTEMETMKGLYQIDGDSLKLYFSQPGAARPASYTDKEIGIMVFKRAAKK